MRGLLGTLSVFVALIWATPAEPYIGRLYYALPVFPFEAKRLLRGAGFPDELELDKVRIFKTFPVTGKRYVIVRFEGREFCSQTTFCLTLVYDNITMTVLTYFNSKEVALITPQTYREKIFNFVIFETECGEVEFLFNDETALFLEYLLSHSPVLRDLSLFTCR